MNKTIVFKRNKILNKGEENSYTALRIVDYMR